PSPTVNVLEQVGDYFGLSADDLGITQAPAATPTPEPTPTQQVVQILPTATPTQGGALLTITPTPAVQMDDMQQSTAQTGDAQQQAGQTAQTVSQDPNAKGGKGNPYLLDEVFTFD